MGPQLLQVVGEHGVAAEERLDGQGGGEVGRGEEHVEGVEREGELAEHPVGAVDEGQALLLGEDDGFQAGGGEGVGRVEEFPVAGADLPLTHDGERAVGERCEVAGAAEGTVLGDDGVRWALSRSA